MKESLIKLLFFIRFKRECSKPTNNWLIRNSLKSFVVSPLIKKLQVCAVRAICIGSKEKYMAAEKKDGKVSEDNEHIVCFFRALLL